MGQPTAFTPQITNVSPKWTKDEPLAVDTEPGNIDALALSLIHRSTLWSSPTFKVTWRPPWNLRPSERTPAVYKNLSSMQVHKQYPSHMKSCQIFLWKQTPAWRHNFYDYKSGLTRTSMLAVPHYTWLHFFFIECSSSSSTCHSQHVHVGSVCWLSTFFFFSS